MHNSSVIHNYIIAFVIFLQICYFLTGDPELVKENIDTLISTKGTTTSKILCVILIMLLIYAFFLISTFAGKKTQLNVYLIFTFIVITLINYSEYRLKTNRTFSKDVQDLDKVIEEATTGDILLFRSYHSHDSLVLFSRFFHSLFSTVFFGHIGMIVKDGNETYICESTEDFHFCHYHKRYKNGPMFSNAKKRIKEYSGRVYLSKNNLHQFINELQIYNSFKQFENHSYFQNGINCLSMVSTILSDLEVMARPYILYLGYDFINPNNYKVDFKQTKNILIKNDFLVSGVST